MSMGAAVKCLGFPKGKTSHSDLCGHSPAFLHTYLRLPDLRKETAISPPHPQLGIKGLDLERQTAPEEITTLWVDTIAPLAQSPNLSHPPIQTVIPHDLFSLQSGSSSARSPQPTYLFTLFLGDPCPVAHGTKELKSQFVEQGTPGTVAVPIEEGKDGLFRSVVILFHIKSQVAVESHQSVSQELDRKDPCLRSASQKGHRLDQLHTGPTGALSSVTECHPVIKKPL